jgi:hypothetical protein
MAVDLSWFMHVLSTFTVTTIVLVKSFQGRGLRVTIRGSYNNKLIPYAFSYFLTSIEAVLVVSTVQTQQLFHQSHRRNDN